MRTATPHLALWTMNRLSSRCKPRYDEDGCPSPVLRPHVSLRIRATSFSEGDIC
jgi:hypothetical protein